ncbi:hypothetical protein C8Q80DRAFT_330551 [Daedaleopsis nitida]|nr:hypothetical protein C8Q80DRAFT_330551 [Daedaleopsis nitida]
MPYPAATLPGKLNLSRDSDEGGKQWVVNLVRETHMGACRRKDRSRESTNASPHSLLLDVMLTRHVRRYVIESYRPSLPLIEQTRSRVPHRHSARCRGRSGHYSGAHGAAQPTVVGTFGTIRSHLYLYCHSCIACITLAVHIILRVCHADLSLYLSCQAGFLPDDVLTSTRR